MIKRGKVYIYPDTRKSTNDYIVLFHKAFEDSENYKLNNRFPQLRLLNLIFNLDSNIFIIHWVDVLPFLRFGTIQYYFLKVCIYILTCFKKEIIWVLHNKTTHRANVLPAKEKQVNEIMDFMAKHSTKVLVHAKDGVSFYNQMYGNKYPNKIIYIPHPVYRNNIICDESTDKEWDFIIWGGITRYKGIDKFLEYTNSSDFFKDKKILICGKCADIEYDLKLNKKKGENVTYINKFLSNEELDSYIKKSNMILFTYSQDSVLSSGALIHSLNYCKPIIAPAVGNFKEFPNIVFCYDDFSDITQFNYSLKIDVNKLEYYIENNTWNKFTEKLLKEIE